MSKDNNKMIIFKQFIENKKGISIYHALLNDCLKNVKAENDYIVDVFLGKKEFNFLSSRLQNMKKQKEFATNRTNYLPLDWISV